VIVTGAPTAPEVGERLVMDGAAAATFRLEDNRRIRMGRMPEDKDLCNTLRINAK